MDMEKYFELPRLGELMLEHSFYMLDGEPILFVCVDEQGCRWLCSCCRMYEEWLVGRASGKALLDMIDDIIPIREVFEKNCDEKFLVTWDGEQFRIEEELPDDVFPKAGAKLELKRARTGAYRKSLEECVRKEERRSRAFSVAGLLLSWEQTNWDIRDSHFARVGKYLRAEKYFQYDIMPVWQQYTELPALYEPYWATIERRQREISSEVILRYVRSVLLADTKSEGEKLAAMEQISMSVPTNDEGKHDSQADVVSCMAA